MRIIQRKKYHYLQHSFRIDGKVVTRERYLGKEIPENIENIKEELNREARKPMYEKLERIQKDFQKEWKKYPPSARQREKQEIAIAFTYNTNAIEGSTITLEDVRIIINDEIAPSKPLKDIKETTEHYNTFLEMLDSKEKISSELLLKWHLDIFSETKPDIVGKYRDYGVRVGEYIAPRWKDIGKLMDELVEFVKESNVNPVELAARAHYRFEKIHPFGDGNGRIGRLIMNHILWYGLYPMFIVEYKKRSAYYRALQGDEDGFVRYFLKRYLAVHEKMYAGTA